MKNKILKIGIFIWKRPTKKERVGGIKIEIEFEIEPLVGWSIAPSEYSRERGNSRK